jgi:hypothetical protein
MVTTSWRALIPALTVAILASAGVASGRQAPASGQPAAGETRETNLRAYMELLRADLRTQKVAIVTEVMQFSEDEDAKFWPIYREYDVELNRINDDRIRLIESYAKAYGTLTDATADDIASRALDLESRRTALKQKYYARLKGAISPKTAARFLQVENQIQLLLDLQIAASLPLAQ